MVQIFYITPQRSYKLLWGVFLRRFKGRNEMYNE